MRGSHARSRHREVAHRHMPSKSRLAAAFSSFSHAMNACTTWYGCARAAGAGVRGGAWLEQLRPSAPIHHPSVPIPTPTPQVQRQRGVRQRARHVRREAWGEWRADRFVGEAESFKARDRLRLLRRHRNRRRRLGLRIDGSRCVRRRGGMEVEREHEEVRKTSARG